MCERKESTGGGFQKVAECLYQYSRNGVYYACIKRGGKETKCSLQRLIGLWRSGSSEISEISSTNRPLNGQPDSDSVVRPLTDNKAERQAENARPKGLRC
jgi:hypothetical protein